ncbi:MAG: hypothetical protein CMJ39_03655 [Phycisphaerae bacterium]|nr:hypothetical protein [Phycisphaerae bacterium]
MIDQVLGWIMMTLGACAIGLWLWSVSRLSKGEIRHCPGGPEHWSSWLHLPSWFKRGSCWQDLHGVPPGANGKIRCPECGKQFYRRDLLRSGPRFRTWLLAGVMAILAISAGVGSWIHSGRWTSPFPSMALVMLSNSPAGEYGTEIRRELNRRVIDGKIPSYLYEAIAGTVVSDLRDDQDRGNAQLAMRLLRSLWPDSRAALEQELHFNDPQSRTLATGLLQSLASVPTAEILESTIKDLRDDSGAPAWYMRQRNALSATGYLLRWYPECAELVRSAMHSDDIQQRFLAAAICGFAGDTEGMHQAVPILASHVADNDYWGDAKLAAPALYRFGPAAIPLLGRYTASRDKQLRGVVLHIIERLEYPEKTWDQCTNRMPRLTQLTHDPLSMSIGFASGDMYF